MGFLSYFKMFFSFLPFLDIFGSKVQFLIDSKNAIQTKIGGFFSIFLIGVFLYSFAINFQSWINGEQLRMISKYDSFTIDEIGAKNASLSFDLNHSNYNIYFTLSSRIGTNMIYNENLQKYMNFYLYYSDGHSSKLRYIEWEYCSNKKMNEFLNSNKNLQNDSVNINRICIKDGQNLTIGYFYDGEKEKLNKTSFKIFIQKCVNSSYNNFSCASEGEINQVLTSANFQVSLPKSYYDFNDNVNTRKRSFDYQSFALDPNILSYYVSTIAPIYLLRDYGMIASEYKLWSVDFNSETSSYQSQSPKNNKNIIFEYTITPSLNQQFYYLKNENIFWLFSSIGGNINFFFILGNIFVFFYNSLILKHKLINFSFSSDESGKTGTQTKSNSNESKMKYSFLNLLCPRFFGNNGYSQALNNIQEYMDIRNLIRRLQEIDKIKIILFDEKGLQEFENLPKPIAKQTNKSKEKFYQTQISDAVEKSLYLKSMRSNLNIRIKDSYADQTKGITQKENENSNNSLSNFSHLLQLNRIYYVEKIHDVKNLLNFDNSSLFEKKEFIQEINESKEKPEIFIEMNNFDCKNKNLGNYMKNY